MIRLHLQHLPLFLPILAASYPAALKTFSSVVNGVTKLVAALFNSPYDEITAIETMLGSMGSSQGYTESFKNLLTHYRKGCQCVFDDTTHLFVNPGEITIPDASGNFRFRKNTAQITVDFTMIDTGAKANSTTYYIYATADASSTNFVCCLSLSATTPTGKTFYRLIGTCATDGSGNFLAGVIQNIYEFPVVGEWEALTSGTIYQASTDGFVVVNSSNPSNPSWVHYEGYTDSSSNPTTQRGMASTRYWSGPSQFTNGSSFTMPVRKGDYWTVNRTVFEGSDTNALYWIPLGA